MITSFHDGPAVNAKPHSHRIRVIRFGLGIGLVYALCVGIIIRLIPGPHTIGDFLIAGTLATLFSLLIVFAVLMAGATQRYRRKHQSPPHS